MAGVLVATELDHFSRIDARTVRKIYEDVSIAAARFADLVALIGAK
jgi:hypothetical protein